MNKKAFFVIFLISLGLTTLGLLVDSDPKNSNLWTTVFEYFAMLTLIFTAIALLFMVSKIVFKHRTQKTV
jgi:hypothetical protein